MKLTKTQLKQTLDSTAGPISLADFSDKLIVLYFYPKDSTSGCTQEAHDFRDNLKQFTKLDAVVLGVSRDSIKSHDKFIEKQDLNFTLISDPDETLCNLFDVMKEKSMYGRKYMGIERSTFIIDGATGKVEHEWRKVKVKEHVETVLAAISAE